MASTLFLFFAEAMSSFLVAQDTGLQGLRLPAREDALLDAKFADDTAAYLHGHEANITRFQLALEQFCDASGAKINWHKSWLLGRRGRAPSLVTESSVPVDTARHGHSLLGMLHWLGVISRVADCTSPLEYQEEIDTLELSSTLTSRESGGG